MEQEEYEREGISWSFISFPDNQECLDLIDGKPNGLLAMLDDECRLPQGKDEKYASRYVRIIYTYIFTNRGENIGKIYYIFIYQYERECMKMQLPEILYLVICSPCLFFDKRKEKQTIYI